MKTSKITFKQVKNLGNYETRHVGVEVELNDGERAIDAFLYAKRFVRFCLQHTDEQIATLHQTFNSLTSAILDREANDEDATDLKQIQQALGFPFREVQNFTSEHSNHIPEKDHSQSETLTGEPKTSSENNLKGG